MNKKWIKVILTAEELLELIQSDKADSLSFDYDMETDTGIVWIEDHSDSINAVCVP